MGDFNEEYTKKYFAKARKWLTSKRFTIYLYCIAIATFIWFLMKFSGSYSTQLPMKATFESPSSQWYVVNKEATFNIDVKGFGFSIIWHSISGISEIKINLSDFEVRGSEEDPFIVVPTDYLLNQVQKLFSDNESIDGIYPNVLKVDLSPAVTKKVPIRSRIVLYPESGFKFSSAPSLYPEKVELAGPAYILSDIKSVNTVIDTIKGLKESQVLTVALDVDTLKEWVKSSSETSLKVAIDEFTSGNIEVSVKGIIDEPFSTLKILPTKVMIYYQVGLKEYQLVNEELFKAYVTFPKKGDLPAKLKVQLTDVPDFVKITRIDPPYVEYLLSKDN